MKISEWIKNLTGEIKNHSVGRLKLLKNGPKKNFEISKVF